MAKRVLTCPPMRNRGTAPRAEEAMLGLISRALAGKVGAKYLYEKPKKRATPNCRRCGNDDAGVVEDRLHMIFDCPDETRMQARNALQAELKCEQWPSPLPELLLYGGRPFATFAQAALTEIEKK